MEGKREKRCRVSTLSLAFKRLRAEASARGRPRLSQRLAGGGHGRAQPLHQSRRVAALPCPAPPPQPRPAAPPPSPPLALPAEAPPPPQPEQAGRAREPVRLPGQL